MPPSACARRSSSVRTLHPGVVSVLTLTDLRLYLRLYLGSRPWEDSRTRPKRVSCPGTILSLIDLLLLLQAEGPLALEWHHEKQLRYTPAVASSVATLQLLTPYSSLIMPPPRKGIASWAAPHTH